MFCRNCGGEITAGVKFCKHCGNPVSAQNATSTPTAKTKSSESLPWLLKFFIVVVVVGSLIYLIFNVLLNPDGNNGAREVDIGMLYELEPTIQPVGFFSEPSLFDSETINDETWLSYIQYTNSPNPDFSVSSNPRFFNQSYTYGTVVKIVCEDNSYYYNGSGTNMDSAGFVVTNLHVLEGGKDLNCIVGFPDPQSGLIREAYWASPIIDKEDETGHDLALLSVEEPVFDGEYNIYGFYEKFTNATFPFYEETQTCLDTAPQLGDQVFILGYPGLSGGALTITDGLVSSLYSADGYLITSAKIGSGNSGGLAIDSNGCFIGVPTAVYSDGQDENYGEIIDAYFVYEFLGAAIDDIEEYSEKFLSK